MALDRLRLLLPSDSWNELKGVPQLRGYLESQVAAAFWPVDAQLRRFSDLSWMTPPSLDRLEFPVL